MPTHTLHCHSVLPYVQKRYIRDAKTDAKGHDFDTAVANVTFAIKDGWMLRPPGKPPTDPCDLIVKYVENKCPCLAADRVLVPVPRKVVTPANPTALEWPGLRIAEALRAAGHAKAVVIALRRHTAVAGSTGKTSQADRVTVQQHIDSLAVDMKLLQGVKKVTLVDDVVTAGTQLMGAMRALQLAGYKGEITALTAFYALQDALSPRTRNVTCTIQWDGTGGWANHL